MKKLRVLTTKIQNKIVLILGLLTLLLGSLSMAGTAFATTYMTHASVLEYNMDTGGTSQVVVNFKAGASDVAGTLTVNFVGWTGAGAGIVNSTQSISTASCSSIFSGSTPLPTSGTLSAAGATSVVTVSSVAALTSGTTYCFGLTSSSAVTNPTSPGQSNVTITDASDTATVAIDNIANDLITVSATVPPSFTLSLSGSTDSFVSNLSNSAYTDTTGVTATINTNATSGWGLWAEDNNAGLTSASEVHTINSVPTGSSFNFTTGEGSDNYGIGVTTDPVAAYAYGTGNTGSGLSKTAFNEIASNGSPASNVTTVLHEIADVSATTPAAQDYSDIVTVVGAGSF